MDEDPASGRSEQARERFARDLAAQWAAAWGSREPDRILALCTEDVVWDDPVFPRSVRGRDPARDYLESLFRAFPDLEFALPVEPFAPLDGERLVLHWDREGTMLGPLAPPGYEATGRRVAFDGVDVLDLREGLVSYVRSRPDARLMQQIGALPFAGSAAERLGVLAQRLQARRMRRRPA